MPWARLNDQANGNAKLLALCNGAWRLWGGGLIYCQANLTDGFIPDHAITTFGVRARTVRELRGFVAQLCASLVPGKGPLWHRDEALKGYRVHDYLDWNDSRASVLEQRRRTTDRVGRFRDRLASARASNKDVTALQPPLPNALPDVLPTENETRSERRMKSGSTTTEDQNLDQDQRRSRVAPSEPEENPRLLTKLAHDVLDDVQAGVLQTADVSAEVKARAAKSRLIYGGDRVRKALDSAEHQRARRQRVG